MHPRTMYIEQKTDGYKPLDNKGPSMIKEVTFSKSGKTIYCQGHVLNPDENVRWKYIRWNGVYGNYYCPQDRSEYWISGVKEDGTNRIVTTQKAQKHEKKRWMNGG